MPTDSVTSQTQKPTSQSARRLMIIGIIILAISECLPYYKERSYMTTERGASSDYRYEYGKRIYGQTDVIAGGEVYNGFEMNDTAIYVLLVLAVVFFTTIYQRPRLNKWVYWVAVFLAAAAVGFPPPVTTLGGAVGAVAFAIIVFAAYKNYQQRKLALG